MKTQIEQAAKRESAATWPLEKLLYGGGLSKAKKGANKGKVSDDLVMFLDYTTNAARNFVMQTFYPLEFTNLANNPEGLSNTKPSLDTLNDVAVLFDRVRVRKDKVGRNLIFTLAFPVYQTKLMITVPPVGMVNTLQYNDVTNAFAQKALAFSDKFFNVDRELDITVPADRVLSNAPHPTGENADKILSARAGFLTEFKRSIKSFRIMAPSILVASKAAKSQQTFINDEGTSFQPLDLDEPDFNMVNPSLRAHANRIQFIKWAAENRVVTVYVNAVIPEAMVLGITENTDLNQVKLQTVSSWFKNSSLSHYTRGDVARADSVVDISRISERNKTTKILETKRTNADGLCITRSGIIYYLPEIDRALEYETEVEKDNLRDDGDFCTSDTKNPENLRYTEVQDPDGTTRRVRSHIPKRANELLYLDLKYGRLSYTDTNGTMQVMSIEEWRPLTTNNIYETLSHKFEFADADELSKRGQFQAGIELIGAIAKAQGFNASDALRQTVAEGTPLYETYRPVLNQIESCLVKGEIRAALMHVAFVLNYASNNKHHYGNDIPLTEQELDILNEYESGGLTLNLIGPDSHITPLQVVYQMVKHYLDYVNADMKEAFHDRSVMTHLRSYALAVMIDKYHGREEALRLQDKAERKEYIDTDPVDIHNVDIAGIPFIRGRPGKPFTLMPHQVTAWTQMRNAPPNLVLDVAAGGGKTLLCIIDILHMIGNKKLDGKPLVMCPGHLVKQYFADVAYATGGSVNVVAITSETMKAWDEEKMAYTIENAPVNTIFITDYSFLSQTKSGTMGYGNRPIQIVYAAEFLRQFKWGGLWLDECFPAGTPIDLPNNCKINIEDVKAGDMLLSVEGPVKVVHTGNREALKSDIVTLHLSNGVQRRVTKNHPYFTNYGWVPAGELQPGQYLMPRQTAEELLYASEEMRMVWEQVPDLSGKTEVLRDILFSEMENVAAGYFGESTQSEGEKENISIEQGELSEESRTCGSTFASHDSRQSYAASSYKEEGEQDSKINGTRSPSTKSGWEWKGTDPVREFLIRMLSAGTLQLCGVYEGQAFGISNQLQNRHGISEGDVSRGSGWKFPLQLERFGSEEGQTSDAIRVVSVESYQSAGDGGLEECETVYNIHVENHPSFSVDGLLVHNSHYLKNQASLRTKAVARLIAGIPFKRQMSGTYAPDTHKDVAGQYALLDPTTFGTQDDFLERYWDEDNRCWRTGSAVEIKSRMNQYAKIVKIKRAAWAAFLPPRLDPETGEPTERFISVELNENQRAFYDKLLKIMKDDMEAKILADPKLRALIEKAREKASDDDEDDTAAATTADEEFEEKLMDKLLHTYVQRLEQFLTAPGSDEAGKDVLVGEDAVSPKAKAVAGIIQEHINRGIEGKVLVFTQYVESGAALVASLPAELRARTLHYVADPAKRDSILREFQVNPKLVAMIGCEKSLNTGLNLQFCSRLIRVESVWNWGTLEQGESRVNRPNPKSEFRKALYFDWIYCNFTLDVTKMSKLFAKCLESAKFNNEDDNRFQQLPTLYAPRLNPDTIFAMNDAESEDPKIGLLEHFSAFQTTRQLEEIQYEEYRNDPNVRKEPLEVPDGEILEGSGFLKEVPYVADMQLYSPSELNLIPYIDYASSHGGLAGFDPIDIRIHTEFGDGVVVKANRDSEGKVKNLRVRLSDGKQTISISKAWIIDIKSVSQKTIRRAIMEGVVKEVTGVEPEPEFQAKPKRGRPVKVLPQSQPEPEEAPVSQEFDMQDEQDIPLDEEPIQEPVVPQRRVKVLKQRPAVRQPRVVRKPREEEPEDFSFDEEPKDDGTFNVEATSIMEALCLYVDTSDPDVPEKELMRDGWIHLRPTASFRVSKPQILQSWWKKVHAHFIVPEPFNTMMKKAIDKMIKMPKKTFLTNITTQQLRNFMLQEARPAKAGEVKPYLLVQARGSNVSPSVRVAIDMKGNREWRKLSQIRVPGMESWETGTGDGLFRIFKQRAQAISYAKQMSRKFKVANLSEVTQALKSIYVVKHEEEEDWA